MTVFWAFYWLIFVAANWVVMGSYGAQLEVKGLLFCAALIGKDWLIKL